MDFEFYNCDPPGGFKARLLRPFRRLLRRVQRPYFQRLRDLLQWLYDRQVAVGQRQDVLATHVDAVHRHHLMVEVAHRARIDQLERAVAELNDKLTVSQHEKAVFQADYLAVTRRLARLEDLLIEVLANPPAACEPTGPSLAKIAS
jgi:hypothetical protein